MPHILRRLPYGSDPVWFAGGLHSVKKNQIIVWVSLNHMNRGWHPRLPRIPTILDTGLSRTLMIRGGHLEAGAELRLDDMPVRRTVQLDGLNCQRVAADIWIHSNIPGRRDDPTGQPPYRLRNSREIVICPDREERARLPILGLPVLAENGLILTVNGVRREIGLRTRFRPWPLTAP
jgi:hypothetical protein